MGDITDSTVEFYAANAQTYADNGERAHNSWLETFTARLPQGGSVLELGCGAGRESAMMRSMGFDITATDGSPELAAIASKLLGSAVEVLRFEDIDFDQRFDGIFANACLLHVPRVNLPDILKRIAKSLKPAGHLYASFKAGETEGFDALGRFYNYPSHAWLEHAFRSVHCWQHLDITSQEGSAYDGLPTSWLHAVAQAESVK